MSLLKKNELKNKPVELWRDREGQREEEKGKETNIMIEKNKPAGESRGDKLPKVDIEQASVNAQPSATQTAPSIIKSKIYRQIESVLEEDLEDIYFKLDAAHQRIFKEEGETTAHQIERVIAGGKSVVAKITELIKRWLGLLPGLNKFFIEQEAKIKADKILNAVKPHH
jgi:hypothetical protein